MQMHLHYIYAFLEFSFYTYLSSTTIDERAWESAVAEERRENSKVFGPVPLLGVRVIDLRRTTD